MNQAISDSGNGNPLIELRNVTKIYGTGAASMA